MDGFARKAEVWICYGDIGLCAVIVFAGVTRFVWDVVRLRLA